MARKAAPKKVNAHARSAEVKRTTKETDIWVRLDLDGSGKADVATGIGFLDHMLESFAKHSMIDLAVAAKGDLHIDGHHTTEDVGITMGEALAEALGDKAGITRFGSAMIPLDEALSRAVVDISGRAHLEWRVTFTRDKLGDMDTELFKEWFAGLAGAAGLTVHLENLYGVNNHHIIESCYKSFARALRQAVERDPRQTGIPSTKGAL
jgi:imidazoleglycerol-phosphate dehydratase